MTTKICSGCGEAKSLGEFPKDPNGKHGCLCHSCAAQYAREQRRGYYRVEKQCSRCGEVKPIRKFAKNKRRRDGRGSYCRRCRGEIMAEWRKRNPEKHRENKRRERLKSKYNITLTDYDDLLHFQNNVCAVCGNPCPTGNRLAVDHDHETGKVRGLLCTNCNMALGFAQDNPELLRELADYLEYHRESPNEEQNHSPSRQHQARLCLGQACAKTRAG